jgi:hypothetical protein
MFGNMPEPLKVPWELRENLSARSGTDMLQDGRTRYWVDEVLAGVTPEMLAWWFAHIDGDMDLDGHRVPRYRVWHPYDHVYAEYIRRRPDGSVGPGAQASNLEYLQRDPRYRIQLTATFERLDNQCMIHNIEVGGLHLGRMEHFYEKTAGGTRFQHILYVPGTPMPVLGRWLLPLVWRPRDKGERWLRHAIEEMGNLPNFLPQLCERAWVK